MGQKPAELTPDASPWHRWGAELRRCRTARGLSLEQLGQQIHVTRSYLSKIERGLAGHQVSRQIAVACDRALNVAGALERCWDEADAATRRSGAGGRVHVSNPPGDVSTRAEQLESQLLHQGPSDDEGVSVPCRLRDGRVAFVTVPRRAFLRSGLALGGMAGLGTVMPTSNAAAQSRSAAAYGATPVEQLRRLRRLLIDSDNLLGPRQVIPRVHEHISAIQALRQDASGADRKQLLELQTQFAEFASWLHQDAGDFRAAQHWLDRALQWSHTISDRDLTAYVLARKSQLAGEMRDKADVVDLAEAARSMAQPGSRLAAVGLTYEAFGYALRDEASAAARAFDQARDAAESLAGDPSPWGVWLNPCYVEVHRAQGLEVMGQHDQAAAAFAAAIHGLPDGYHRDRGVYLARQAVAHAGAGAPEQAAYVGQQALAIAHDTGSGRIVNELTRLDDALQPWKAVPEVTDFRAGFDGVILHEE